MKYDPLETRRRRRTHPKRCYPGRWICPPPQIKKIRPLETRTLNSSTSYLSLSALALILINPQRSSSQTKPWYLRRKWLLMRNRVLRRWRRRSTGIRFLGAAVPLSPTPYPYVNPFLLHYPERTYVSVLGGFLFNFSWIYFSFMSVLGLGLGFSCFSLQRSWKWQLPTD